MRIRRAVTLCRSVPRRALVPILLDVALQQRKLPLVSVEILAQWPHDTRADGGINSAASNSEQTFMVRMGYMCKLVICGDQVHPNGAILKRSIF